MVCVIFVYWVLLLELLIFLSSIFDVQKVCLGYIGPIAAWWPCDELHFRSKKQKGGQEHAVFSASVIPEPCPWWHWEKVEEISAMPQGFLAIYPHSSIFPTKYLLLTETKSLGIHQRVHKVSGKKSLSIYYLPLLSLALYPVFLFLYFLFYSICHVQPYWFQGLTSPQSPLTEAA